MITIKIIIENKPLLDGKHRIYLRVIKDRKRKLISLGISCESSHFENGKLSRKHKNYKSDNDYLIHKLNEANKIIREFELDNDDFNLSQFENRFRGVECNDNYSVVEFVNELIEEMIQANRIGNAKAYSDTRDSLISFVGKSLTFKNLNHTFLEKYESYLRSRGNSNGGIGFKMREIRAIFNKAIDRKIVNPSLYPFNSFKASKFKSKKQKKALSKDEFYRFKHVDLDANNPLIEAHNYFMFSIYARGMNFMDMMLLRWSDVSNDRITYVRSKTKVQFSIEIVEPMRVILDYYRKQNRSTGYVFPILLKEGMSPTQIANRKHKVLSRYNKKLKLIGERLNIDKPITSYIARHSYATLLKFEGASTDKISELMGHSSIEITNSYLKEFDSSDLDTTSRKLLDI